MNKAKRQQREINNKDQSKNKGNRNKNNLKHQRNYEQVL